MWEQTNTALLGLSTKFIVKPEYTHSPNDTQEALDRLEQDLHLKIFFSGVEPEESDKPRSKLRVKLDWRPDVQDVPHFVDTRLERFSKALANEFCRHKAKPNLLPNQEEVLEYLRQAHEVVVVNSDKGVGPCAIELDRYI